MPAGAMLPEDDPGWAAYAQTILVVHGHPPFDIDLAGRPDAVVRAALARCGLQGPFGLVTPCNPRGRIGDAADNARRLARFLGALDACGAMYVRVDGVSRDRRHLEPGVALRWPQAEVAELARAWDQSAIYWWDGTAFWVVGALTVAPPWQLGAVR